MLATGSSRVDASSERKNGFSRATCCVANQWGTWNFRALLSVFAAGTVLVLHLLRVADSPLYFDEAFNLQVPLNLALAGKYQTWYGEPKPFNYHITTGPTVLLPVAGMFLLFGPNPIAARLVMTGYFLLFLYVCWKFCCRLLQESAHRLFALACAFLVIIPELLLYSARVLGELPAVALFLAGTLVVERQRDHGSRWHAFAGGVLLGLAVLTKLVLALMVPVALLAVLASRQKGAAIRERIVAGFVLVVGAGLPLLAWEGLQAAHFGVAGWLQLLERRWFFLLFAGSGLNWMAVTQPERGPWAHVVQLATTFGRSPQLIALGLSLLWAAYGAFLKRSNFCGRVLFAATMVHFAWWVFLSSWVVYHHLVVGLFFHTLAGAYLLLRTMSASWRSRYLGMMFRLAVAAGLLCSMPWPQRNTSTLPYSFREQQDVANRLIELLHASNSRSVWAFGWSQVPAVSFLAQVPFGNIAARSAPLGEGNHFFIVEAKASSEALAYAHDHCAEWLVQSPAGSICRLRPNAPPGKESFPVP